MHHFLLALCTRPGVGLCFHDRGWYPRETDPDQNNAADADDRTDADTRQKGGKIYNKILANVLKTLKVNEDPRQQELALKVLAACPELVAGYWPSAGLALEPRLSSKWLANIAFFGAVVSLPVPTASFFLPESGSGSASLYQPSPRHDTDSFPARTEGRRPANSRWRALRPSWRRRAKELNASVSEHLYQSISIDFDLACRTSPRLPILYIMYNHRRYCFHQ